LLKILNFIYFLLVIFGSIFLLLITVLKTSHATEIYLLFILIALGLKFLIFCLKNKDKNNDDNDNGA